MILQTITPVYYPIHVGNRQIFAGTGNGPKSYDAVNGDPLSVAFTPFFIDDVLGPVISQDGTKIAIPRPITTGKGSTWALYWYTFTLATGALAGIASATDLSAQVVQLSVIGGA